MDKVHSCLWQARVHPDIVYNLKDHPEQLRTYLRWYKKATGAGLHLVGQESLLKQVYSALNELDRMSETQFLEDIEMLVEIREAGSPMAWMAKRQLDFAKQLQEEAEIKIRHANEDQAKAVETTSHYTKATTQALARLKNEELDQSRIAKERWESIVNELKEETKNLREQVESKTYSNRSLRDCANWLVEDVSQSLKVATHHLKRLVKCLQPVTIKPTIVLSSLLERSIVEESEIVRIYTVVAYRISNDGRVHRQVIYYSRQSGDNWSHEEEMTRARDVVAETLKTFSPEAKYRGWQRIGYLIGTTALQSISNRNRAAPFRQVHLLDERLSELCVLTAINQAPNFSLSREGKLIISSASGGSITTIIKPYSSEIHNPTIW